MGNRRASRSSHCQLSTLHPLPRSRAVDTMPPLPIPSWSIANLLKGPDDVLDEAHVSKRHPCIVCVASWALFMNLSCTKAMTEGSTLDPGFPVPARFRESVVWALWSRSGLEEFSAGTITVGHRINVCKLCRAPLCGVFRSQAPSSQQVQWFCCGT